MLPIWNMAYVIHSSHHMLLVWNIAKYGIFYSPIALMLPLWEMTYFVYSLHQRLPEWNMAYFIHSSHQCSQCERWHILFTDCIKGFLCKTRHILYSLNAQNIPTVIDDILYSPMEPYASCVKHGIFYIHSMHQIVPLWWNQMLPVWNVAYFIHLSCQILPVWNVAYFNHLLHHIPPVYKMISDLPPCWWHFQWELWGS